MVPSEWQKKLGGKVGKQFKGELKNVRPLIFPPPDFFCYSNCPIWSIIVSLQGFFLVYFGLNVFLGHKNPIQVFLKFPYIILLTKFEFY